MTSVQPLTVYRHHLHFTVLKDIQADASLAVVYCELNRRECKYVFVMVL
jgi:hypothetical protein